MSLVTEPGTAADRPAPPPERAGAWGRLALVFLPFLLLDLLGEVFLANRQEGVDTAFRLQAQEFLERLAVRGDEDLYAPLRLRRLWRAWGRTSPRRRPLLVKSFVGGLGRGLDCEIYGFDAAGGLVPDLCHQPGNRWLARTLFAELARPAGGKGALDAAGHRRLERALVQTFGYGWSVAAFQRHQGRVARISLRGKERWVTWDHWPDGGFLAICRGIPPVATRLLQGLRQEPGGGWPGLVWGSGVPAIAEWEVGGPATTDEVKAVWEGFSVAGAEVGEVFDRFYVFRQNARGRVTFGGFPRPPSCRALAVWIWRGVTAAGFLAAAWFLCWTGDRLGSIRRLSVGLFLYAGLIPGVGMILGASQLLQSRAAVLGHQVQRFQMEMLNDLDTRFHGFLKTLGEQVSRVTRAPAFPADFAAAARAAGQWVGANPVARMEFRGPGGEFLWASHPEQGGLQALLPVLTRLILSRWAPVRYRPPTREADKTADQILAVPDIGMDTLANFPRSMLPIDTGGKSAFLFWDLFPDPAWRAAVVAFLFSREKLVHRYVRQQMGQRWSYQDTPIRVEAYDLERGGWLTPSFPGRGTLVPIVMQATLMRRPKTGRIELGGQAWWMTVVPARNLTGISLVGLFPDTAFRPRLDALRWRIGLGGVVALAVALVLGTFIGRRLLAPVAHLEQGVEALRARDFGASVPVVSRDELGDLARAFNSMVEEMRELDVARAVQAGLTPQSFPEIPGYDLHGFTIFAGDLGGDCLDVRRLPDGRLFLLVGDVSGHGVGSALLMAFNKALLSLWARQPSPAAGDLFRLFDRALRQGKGERRFLAAFGAVLDPVRHELEYVCGGHPFPFLRRRGGEVTLIGDPAYPLASRHREEPVRQGRLQLEPGDLMFFYTDGLVEGLDAGGQPYGYDALAAWLRSWRPGRSARGLLEEFWTGFRAARPRHEDDITLVALCRKEEA